MKRVNVKFQYEYDLITLSWNFWSSLTTQIYLSNQTTFLTIR